MATLVFHTDEERDIVVPLLETVTVGSSEGNDVLVEDTSVSPSHAEVAKSITGNFVVRDLGSETGTFVNGRRIKAHPLCEGDEIAFGNLRGHFVLDERERSIAFHRENEERDLRRRLEQVQREFEQAQAKHVMLYGMLLSLGEEEKKRLENLDNLQRAINGAESSLAVAEAAVKSARDEALKGENLRAENASLQDEVAKIMARRDALLADEEKALSIAKEKFADEAALLKKQFEQEKAQLHAQFEEEKALSERKIQENKALFQKQIDELNENHQAARRQLVDVQEQITRTSVELAKREESLAEIEDSIASAEAQRDEMTASLSECEAILARSRVEKQRAVEEQEREQDLLEKLADKKTKALQELTALSSKQSTLAANQAVLRTALAALEVSVRDMTQRQAEGILTLRERERNLRDALKGAERAKAEQSDITNASRELEAQRDRLQESLHSLASELEGAETRIAELGEAELAKNDQITALTSRIHQLEDERDAVRARVEALAGTEESLLQARHNLMKAREDHAAFVALTAERDTRRQELDSLNSTLERLNITRVEVEQTLTAAHTSLKDFQRDATAERARLTTEAESLAKDAAQKKENLAALLKQLQDTTARHEQLLQHNRELAGVEDALQRSNAELSRVQREQAELAAQTASFERDAESARTRLEGLQSEVKAVSSTLERRREEETALNKAVANLQGEQTVETRRLEEIRRVAAETARKAASDSAEQDAALEKRRREIQEQDDQIRKIQSLREEIDALYAQIESSSEENASSALAAWREARARKEELTGLLPKEGGIRVKPQGRTVLVRRTKEG